MKVEIKLIRTKFKDSFIEQFGDLMKNPRFIRALYVKYEDNHWQAKIELKATENV